MKHFNFILLAGFAGLFYSCSDEEKNGVVDNNPSEVPVAMCSVSALKNAAHKINPEEAEKLALELVNSYSSSNGLKDCKMHNVSNIQVVGRNTRGLKSSGNLLKDTMAYIVNFSDSTGFAYVAADNRVTTPVIAFFDRGNLNAESLSEKSSLSFMLEKANSYIQSAIVNFEENKEYFEEIVKEVEEKDGFDVNRTKASATQSISNRKGPFLTTQWSQGTPFNMAFPTCSVSGCNEKAICGCTSIGLAQIMNKWRFPERIGNTNIPWDFINSVPYSQQNMINVFGQRSLLIRRVAEGCKTTYHCGNHNGSGGSVKKGLAWMESLGYSTRRTSYDGNEIINHLNNKQNPIEIDGRNAADEGHVWVLDGFITVKYSVPVVVTYSNGKKGTVVQNNYVNFIHNNWGWEQGVANGYFISGSFYTGNPYGEYDNPRVRLVEDDDFDQSVSVTYIEIKK